MRGLTAACERVDAAADALATAIRDAIVMEIDYLKVETDGAARAAEMIASLL
jgi:hypothetical protein